MNEPKDIQPLERLIYTVAETAVMLQVSQKTVYRLIKRGLLRAPSEIRHKRITAASLKAFAGAVA